ncbi:MAG: hypothetical protein Q9174_000603 [Haloplaca sp. 1 TL-2023]
MTAVVSPSSVPPHSQWNPGDSGQGGLHSMNAEDVTRMFMPRKSAQRTNSSSSVASSSSSSSSSASSSSTITTPASSTQANGERLTTNGEQGAWPARKKAQKGLWPPTKSDSVSEMSNGRPPPIPTPSSGQSAASTMSAMHQPSPILPSQHRSTTQQQQTGNRIDQSPSQSEAPAILALQPLTGTFERKQINVPFFPEVLRIGRQTNAKTVPTTANGYFDSKVLSRQHAEVWADRNGKIWIRDVKSSNGTFVNGVRLSPENRDSEPHELREQDTLELGIDIVSEDQKSIVHHKVSAKVEHAGVYSTGTSVLDLNFGDIDPNTGNALGQMGHGMPQLRGRGVSQGSNASNGRLTGPPSVANGGANGISQRQMNLWMNPITIEQVVRRLTTELKQAKQQSQDLHRTGDFFTTLLTLAPGEEMPKAPETKLSEQGKQPNGLSIAAPHIEAISPFSQPPAPPPQQPLPEKPTAARSMHTEPLGQFPLKRMETERPHSFSKSPTRPEPPSSQILSLVEALSTARKEIDSQGDRVKQLENLLKRERKARENAEERARCLMAGQPLPNGDRDNSSNDDIASHLTAETTTETDSDALSDTHSTSDNERSAKTIVDANSETAEDLHRQTENVDASTSQLQTRLDQMVREMDLMKAQMDSYKQRAEGAEAERTSLADMIQRIRKDNARTDGAMSNGSVVHPFKHSSTTDGNTAISSAINRAKRSGSGLWNGTSSTPSSSSSTSSLHDHKQPNGTTTSSGTVMEHAEPSGNLQALERSMAAALQQQSSWVKNGGGKDVAMHSAPYVSMVGVVLIGVGLMTWLNGWQKVDR